MLLLQLPDSLILTILKSLHWLRVQERIEYKVISITCKLLQSFPRYLRDFITVQPSRSTRSSALVTVLQLSVDSSVRSQTAPSGMPHRTCGTSFLLATLRVPYQFDPLSPSSSPSSYSDPQPIVDLSHGVCHSRLKTFLFSTYFHPWPSIPSWS